MIALSTTQPVRFTPSWMASAPDAPVYLLRAGSVIERELLEADLASEHRADRVSHWELDEAARAGVAAIVSSADDAARILQVFDAESALEDGDELEQQDAQLLAEARRILAEHWPDYRALTAQLARRNTILPVEAFRRFCVGWEGRDAAFALGVDRRVTEEALASVSPLELRSTGVEAYRLLYVRGAEKNSVLPSNAPADRRTSRADGGSKAAGRSTAKRGRRTRA